MPSQFDFYRGIRRYPFGVDASGAAFTITGGGRKLNSTFTQQLAIFPTGEAQGVQVWFCGTGADNSTFDYRIWLLDGGVRDLPTIGSTQGTSVIQSDYQWSYWGGGSCTLSTAVGVASGLVTASERYADTITFTLSTTATTPSGPGTVLETAYASPGTAAYSPADNTPGMLVIPRLGWPSGIVIDFDMTGATSAFALIAAR